MDELRLFLIATCDNNHEGKFNLNCGERVLLKGNAHVVRAPAIVEEDGFTFPPGAHFGAGLWEIECVATDGQRYRAIAEVCDWTSTD